MKKWNSEKLKKAKEVVIETEIKCKTVIGDYSFFGVIDRLDKINNDTYEIYDYKTGKKTISKYSASNDLQLIIYLSAIKEKLSV